MHKKSRDRRYAEAVTAIMKLDRLTWPFIAGTAAIMIVIVVLSNRLSLWWLVPVPVDTKIEGLALLLSIEALAAVMLYALIRTIAERK
jgi:hypothetical protein